VRAPIDHEEQLMKMIVLFRRKPELTREQFCDHYEHHHAPLALKLFPYMKEYRRNYIRQDVTHRRTEAASAAVTLAYDVITEIVFTTDADYRRMVHDMTDAVIRDQVITDELRFLDRSATVVFLTDDSASCP
jgi:EthD domain